MGNTANIGGLFQAMGIGGPQGPPPNQPDIQAQAPDPLAAIGISAPSVIANAPPDPLAVREAQLQAQLNQITQSLNTPPKNMMDQNLADFQKFADARYKEKYLSGGKIGVANRFLQEMLSGLKGQTLEETNSKAAQDDWKNAMAMEAQRIAAQKNQQALAADALRAQLNDVRNLRATQIQQQNANTRQTQAEVNAPGARATASQKANNELADTLEATGQYTPEQIKFVRANGKLPTPSQMNPRPAFMPGVAKGADIKLFHPNAQSGGKSLDDSKYYRLNASTGDYEPSTPPGYEVPQTTVAERPTTIGDTVQSIPYSTTRGPSDTVQPPTGGAGVGRVLGPSSAGQRRAEEPTYTPAGQQAIAEAQPVIDMLSRAQELLDPVKDVNQPLQFAVQRLGYSVGYATEASKLINELELEKVVGAARVLKGSSRAVAALQLAMQHLPDPKKDSAKLMTEKIGTILSNLRDIQAAADKYERKYPGRTDVKPDQINAPSTKPKVKIISVE